MLLLLSLAVLVEKKNNSTEKLRKTYRQLTQSAFSETKKNAPLVEMRREMPSTGSDISLPELNNNKKLNV